MLYFAGNNCICSDYCFLHGDCKQQIKGDVAALREYNFDSWKLDGCGSETNLEEFNAELNATGRPILVENCHWGVVVSGVEVTHPSVHPSVFRSVVLVCQQQTKALANYQRASVV